MNGGSNVMRGRDSLIKTEDPGDTRVRCMDQLSGYVD